MKKTMMLLIAAVMLFSVTGQAMAAFNEGDLIRVVYNQSANGNGTEYATDLGAFSATTPLTSTITYNTGNFGLANVGASSMADVNVAYFVMSTTANPVAGGANGAAYTSGPANGGTINSGAFWSPFQPATSNVLDAYNTFGTKVGNSSTLSQSNANSYWNQLNGGGTGIGTMGGYVIGNAEKNLGALSTSSYVDQVLYYYGSDPDAGAKGTNIATIRTFADGSTQLVAQATPIPAAIYLFGSGLMGLVGLRRKTAA